MFALAYPDLIARDFRWPTRYGTAQITVDMSPYVIYIRVCKFVVYVYVGK